MSETRALSAALSGPTFEGAASRSALHASERHVERWAPEGPSAARSRGLRSLAFADRVASPWMSTSMMGPRSHSMFGGGHQERSAPGVSWVFPRPWFQDELDWMAAGRQAAESSPQFLTTRGTYASARTSPSDVSMPMIAPELVVPSMMAASMGYGSSAMAAQRATAAPSMTGLVAGMAPAAAAMQHGLRAWSPSVPFAAAAAAEVMAGAVSAATSSGLSSVAERSPLLAGLTMVSPASMSGQASSSPRQSAALDASTVAAARLEQGRRESSSAVAAQSTAATASGDAIEASASVQSPLSSAERAMSSTIGASPSMSGALRAIELLVGSPAPRSSSEAGSWSSSETGSSQAGPSYASETGRSYSSSAGLASAPGFAASPASWSSVAEPPTSAGATRSTSTLSPVVGPRVALPVGLGGLAAALETAQTIASPMARSTAPAPLARAAAAGLAAAAGISSSAGLGSFTGAADSTGAPAATATASPGFRGFSPVWAAPATALAAVAGDRARGVDHLAWSDRWLARFAGASPVALAALDVSRGEVDTTPRLLSAHAPEQVYLHPQMAPSRLRAALDAGAPGLADGRAAAPAPASRPTGVLRIDDDASVPDAIFAAIAAASSSSRAPGPISPDVRGGRAPDAVAPELPPQSMADAVRRGGRPTAADLASISAPVAPDAGLSPGLASSPMAAAMAGVLPLPAAPVFDTRALYASGMATAYLGGLTARAAAPVGVLASAPSSAAMASVARFGDLAAAGGAMSGWALRDLAVAPMALRLAEQAPERPMVATGGDVDVVLRRGGVMERARDLATAAPTWTSPVRRGAGRVDPDSVDQVMVASPDGAVARLSAGTVMTAAAGPSGPGAAAPQVQAFERAAASERTAASEQVAVSEQVAAQVAASERAAASEQVAASRVASLPAIEPELLALRSALLAGPTSLSAPLAHSASPMMLSAAMSVPSAPSSWSQSEAVAGAPASLAQPLLTLPSIGAQAPSSVAAAMASHAATGAFVPPALAAAGTASAAAADPSSPSLRGSGRPGAFAEQALRWSVAEERSAGGLSFDFVTPEMVLAARVYGLSPASAVEATRLAVAGPSALASLAGSLDLTFLRSFQQVAAGSQVAGSQVAGSQVAGSQFAAGSQVAGSQVAGSQVAAGSQAVSAASTAFASASAEPGASPSSTAGLATAVDAALELAAVAPSPTAATWATPGVAAPMSLGAWDASNTASAGLTAPPIAGAHGPGRMPRGAFLWPAGVASALGLRAQSTDGVGGLPVVALELLAAQAVADLGTWVTAFPGATPIPGGDRAALIGALRAAGLPVPPALAAIGEAAGASSPMVPLGAGALAGAPVEPAGAPVAGAASMVADAAAIAPTSAEAAAAFDDTIVSAGVEAAASPAALRSRFEAVYIAMSRSPEGLSLSPSARAARAMAIVAGSNAAGLSPRARAAAVWSVMPQVFQGDLDMVAPDRPAASDAEQGWAVRPNMVGLAGLASRAGEALGSFVSPQQAELATAGGRAEAASRGSVALADRVDSPVYVDTARPDAGQPDASSVAAAMRRPGRTFSQVGGGEPEIPAWFEGAARKMLEGRAGDGGGGMSLAEMVLVNAVPQKQIAASTKSANSGGGGGHSQGKGQKGEEHQPDVGRLAHDVYAEVLKLIDAARERGGDPYQ